MKMLQHKFVEFIPEKIEENVLYISIEYCTAIHKCVCGCKNEVVTPLSPTDWKLTFNGKTVTLYPSIGNWNFKCQSHYWIRNNKIEFADRRDRKIHLVKKNDLDYKMNYFKEPENIPKEEPNIPKNSQHSIWQIISKLFQF